MKGQIWPILGHSWPGLWVHRGHTLSGSIWSGFWIKGSDWPGIRVKGSGWPGFWVKEYGPDGPRFRVKGSDRPGSGSIKVTLLSGSNWPEKCMAPMDPDSGSKAFDPERVWPNGPRFRVKGSDWSGFRVNKAPIDPDSVSKALINPDSGSIDWWLREGSNFFDPDEESKIWPFIF